MASNLPKRDHGSLIFEAEKPHFFKIILDVTITDGKLGIPKRFLRKYGNDLSSPTLLKVPSGAKWKVEIIKSDGEIWLKNGWKEFMEYYALTQGSFLVFEYDKKSSHFNVIIFDKSASEIDYPCLISNGDDNNLGKEFQAPKMEKETENEPSFEILDDFSSSGETEQISQPHKKMKFVESFTTKVKVSKKQLVPSFSNLSRPNEAAKEFTSVNPFFKVIISSSHLRHNNIEVPKRFIINIRQRAEKAKLQVADKWWLVNLRKYPHRGRTSFGRGWPIFAKENSLRQGDVCVYELLDDENLLIKVHIFRNV